MDSSDDGKSLIGRVLFDKYKIEKRIGEGSFGSVYQAMYNNEYFALKFESRKEGRNLLENEAEIMNYLKGPNIPKIKSFGHTDEYNIMVMELLGKSLIDLYDKKGKFHLKTICMLAVQMLNILERIHNNHFVHRDIKPDNFVMGLYDLSGYVYLLDFGLAKKYRSSSSLAHYPMVTGGKLTGTARYASRNAHKGISQSRRDDLEGLAYVLIYLLKGSLPWQGFKAKSKEDKYRLIYEKKIEITPSELCRKQPIELEQFVECVRNLEYTEDPNYEYYRNLFLNILETKGLNFEYSRN